MSTPEAAVTQQISTNTETPAKPAVDPGVQKRINELTFKHREQERRALAAEAELASYREREAKAKEKPAETDKRKTLADFNYDEAEYDNYLEERHTAKAEAAAAKKAKEAVAEHAQETERAKTTAERSAKWRERASEFAKAHPDFVEVVYADDVQFSDAVVEAIAESEVGPQLAYHLAQNPDELSRIARLSPAAAGRELGKLEAKLSVTKTQEAEETTEKNASADLPPPRAATKAPPPPPKIDATESVTKKAWNDPKLSQEEFNKRRREFSARRR